MFGSKAFLILLNKFISASVKAICINGAFDIPIGQNYAKTTGEILVFHGSADESVSLESFATLGKTLEAAKVAHEMVTYSGAPHAFSVFGSDRYNARADQRSWQRYLDFLADKYKLP